MADNKTFRHEFGQAGATVETGTTLVTAVVGKPFFAIMAVEATVFASLTATDWDGDSTAALPLPAGAVIYGQFTAFQLTSGKVIAYKVS